MTRYAVLIGLTSLLAVPSYVNPKMIVLSVLPLFLYLVFYIARRGREAIPYALKFAAIVFIVCLALNLWWFVPWVNFTAKGVPVATEVRESPCFVPFSSKEERSTSFGRLPHENGHRSPAGLGRARELGYGSAGFA